MRYNKQPERAMEIPMLDTVINLPLKDSSLLRQANLPDGAWVGADSGETVPVANPANGAVIATVPAMGTGETRGS